MHGGTVRSEAVKVMLLAPLTRHVSLPGSPRYEVALAVGTDEKGGHLWFLVQRWAQRRLGEEYRSSSPRLFL